MIVDQGRPHNSVPLQFGSQKEEPVIIIVDDDEAIRLAVSELILSAGFQPLSFASIRELLECDALDRHGCLILDVRMPGASGLELQHHLIRTGNLKPIIFLTGHGDIPMSVDAMRAGAVDFLTKPVRDQTLLDAVSRAITLDRERRVEHAVVKRNLGFFEALTAREREVLREVAQGRLNKQIAHDLGISEVTVKLHRGNVMRKMNAKSLGELIRAWQTLPVAVRDAEETYSSIRRPRVFASLA